MSARRVTAGDSEAPSSAKSLAIHEVALRSPGLRALALFALFAAVSVATRLPFLRAGFLNVDEASHLLGAWTLLDGGRLYVDFADNKPPLVYLFYALAQLCFGRSMAAVRLFTAVTAVPLTALAAAAFFGHGRRGVAAAIAFLVASVTLLGSDAHAVHCEHVMLVPLAWSLAVLRSPCSLQRPARLALAGALVGVATLGKQPAALCVAALGAAVLLSWRRPAAGQRRSWARLLGLEGALAAGFVAPLALAAGFFALQGSLRQAVFWTWQFNLSHIDNPMPLADKVARVIKMGALVAPAAVPLALAAFSGRESRTSGHRRRLPLLLCAATLAPAFLGLRLFGHYFLPFLFTLSLVAAPYLGARRQARGRVWIAAFGAFALTCFTFASRLVYDPRSALADVARPAYERIGEALRADHCEPDGGLFVWGYAPEVYAYAGARPASRFVVPVDTLTGYLAGNDAAEEGRIDTRSRISTVHWAELMADLEAHRPAHIVDTAPGDLNRWGRYSLERFPQLRAFVQDHYHPFALVDGAVLYRRNDCRPAEIAEKR
jgi:hypothetical protein